MVRVIGITCGWREEETRHMLHDEFIRAVCGIGGIPFLIPTAEPDLAGQYYARVDGLIFSGGADPDPVYYGEEPNSGIGEITPKRDSFELALAELALKGEKPVLAICRGLQVINIAAGGSLYQDLKGITPLQHRQQAPRWYPTHQVRIVQNSRLYTLIKKDTIRVNSFHHQGINKIGSGLQAVASSDDGLIEAVEAADAKKCLFGIQWHPECFWEKDESSYLILTSLLAATGEQKGLKI